MHATRLGVAAIAAAAFSLLGTAHARAAEPIALAIDASQAATQNVLFAHETMPVKPGALTLYYPKWIPGEHMPVGPIQNLSGIVITGNGAVIPWRRDPRNMYAFELTVPHGVSSLDIAMTYLGATFGSYSSNRLASANMGTIIWDQTLLYPSTGTIQDTVFKPTLTLPGDDWKFATALTGAKRTGNTVTWDAVTLEHLIDSPLDMGVNYRRWDIWHDGDAHAYLNVFGDTPNDIDVSDKVVAHYGKLVREMIAMYGARHWRNYNFLLTVSDVIPGEGIEHHESSDDGGPADYLTNPKVLDRGADLLSHEFNHSWDGKYRMPVGLYQPNLQMPYDDSLLWVYEGMTQYYGNVMSWRDGLRKPAEYPDHIAAVYAYYDNEPGRKWRPLLDTAVSGPFLYNAPRQYVAERRSVDFYSEGELMWLKVDSIIREKTNNRESLDTFAREFFGGKTTGPIVKTYDRADVIAGLQKVLPYDWAGFFKKWVDEIAIHPPNGFTADGWKLVYTDKPSHWVPKSNVWYSLGINAFHGQVVDVRQGSPAWKAGLGVNTTIVAVDGRKFSDDLLYDAIENAKSSHQPIALLVAHTDAYRTISIDYDGGNRYPHLVRIPGTPDRLMDVIKPYTK